MTSPIIDTHQHLWDLDQFTLGWLNSAPPVLQCSYVTKDYLEAARDLGIEKAVYMEVDVDPSQADDEADYILGLCQDQSTPTVGAVVRGRPGTREFSAQIEKYRGHKYIKGFRQVLHVPDTPAGSCRTREFVEAMRSLGDAGLSFDLCMRPRELADAVELADQAPHTRLILDHCGNADPKAFLPREAGDAWHDADQWKTHISELSERPNVICKISGIIARAPEENVESGLLAPIINHCLDAFGPERVVFGSDWPVCRLRATLAKWVELLREVINSRPEAEQRQLLYDNAVRLYRLPA